MLEDFSPVIYCTLLIFFGAVLWHAFLWAIFSGLTETLEKIQCFVDGLKQTIKIIAIPFLWVFRKHIAHHFQTPFPFEDLPPEIAWKIIDYVPEAVLDLRAASRSMKSCVDQYAVLCQINLVKSLSILPDNAFTRSVWLKKSVAAGDVYIKCEIPKCNSKLFNLRLNLQQISHKCADRSTRKDVKHYSWEVSERDCALLNTLRECFGKQIDCVTMGTFEQPNESIGAVRILLQGVLIKKLQVVCSAISESVVNYTFAAVAHFKVDELTVTYQMGETQRTVGFFIGISEHIRSLHICQMTVQGPHTFAHLDRHINWLPVILEIFSRKVDKLLITSQMYQGYLNREKIDSLEKHLPMLGKRVWFEAHHVDSHMWPSVTRNEYRIAFNENPPPGNHSSSTCRFSIKHVSRTKEKFELHCI